MSDGTKAEVIEVNGRKAWLYKGVILPYIAGGSGDGDGVGDGDGDGEGKVEFTETQQAHIDKLIGSKFAEAHTKAEAKSQIEIDALKLELETAKASKETKKAAPASNPDLTALTDKIAVLEADKIKGFQTSSESNIIAEASDLKAVNSRQVYDLLKSQIVIAEDGTRKVVNAEGQDRITDTGPMTEKALVAEFMAANPHLVQASGKSGSGSQAPGFGESNDEDLAKLSGPDQLTELRARKAAKK